MKDSDMQKSALLLSILDCYTIWQSYAPKIRYTTVAKNARRDNLAVVKYETILLFLEQAISYALHNFIKCLSYKSKIFSFGCFTHTITNVSFFKNTHTTQLRSHILDSSANNDLHPKRRSHQENPSWLDNCVCMHRCHDASNRMGP